MQLMSTKLLTEKMVINLYNLKLKIIINYIIWRGIKYERTCDSCHTYGLSTLIFLELRIIKDFHSFNMY